MKWKHLTALVWLRWRLFAAQFRKMGLGIKVMLAILFAFVFSTTLGGGIGAFFLSLWLLPAEEPLALLLTWDALTAFFLLAWSIGFISELQRSEPLSIEKLMHMPVSLRSAFFLNYLSSLASLTLAAFLPAMLAICLAAPFVYGFKSLVALPLLIGLVALVTSVTFQIRGWLARMMANPRKRRAVLVIMMTVFIAACQLPGLLGAWFENLDSDEPDEQRAVAQAPELPAASQAQPQTAGDNLAVENEDPEQQRLREQARKQKEERAKRWVLLGHKLFPPAWLPYGAYAAAEGQLLPGLLGAIGLLLFAAASLRLSYRSTIDYYLKATRSPQRKLKKSAAPKIRNAVERPFPLVSKHVGTVATTNLCHLWRSPTVKMQMLVPVFVMLFPMIPLFNNRDKIPVELRPFVALGIISFALFMSFGLTLNIFGYDREAFRSYMLMPVRWRDILLGKNLSVVPLMLILWSVGCIGLMWTCPLRWYDFLAANLLMLAAFLLTSMLGNYVSTRFPFPVPNSTMRRPRPKWQTILAQFAVLFILPILLLPIAAPFTIDTALRFLKLLPGFSLSLPLSLLVLLVTFWVYWQLLDVAGELLWRRQREVLLEITRTGQ